MQSLKNKRSQPQQSLWSNIIPEVLELIIDRLDVVDRINLRMVCRSWRSVAKNYRCFISNDPIRLMIPRRGGESAGFEFGFYSVLRRKFTGTRCKKLYNNWRCCGHLDGWFAVVSDKHFSIMLFNIVNGCCVRLPCSFRSIRKYADGLLSSVRKVVMSAVPTEENCVVVVMGEGSNSIAVCRVRGDKWVMADTKNEVYEDFIVYKGKLYALHFDGKLTVYGLGSFPRIYREAVLSPGQHLARQRSNVTVTRYLVESLGELLLVSSHYEGNSRCIYRALEFHVSELDETGWVPVTSLGDQALFVGRIKSESVLVDDNLKSENLKQNHIYFASKTIVRTVGHVMGVFSMSNMIVKGIPIRKSHLVDCEPIWIKTFLV